MSFQVPEPTNDHDEARRELTSMIEGKITTIPAWLLVEHVLLAYGDAGWAVVHDAAQALLRRHAFAQADALRVARRPPRSAVWGSYRTRRARSAERPYATSLFSLQPLQTSCDCPDFLKGGLGLCKHGLVVLEDIASRPRVLRRALGQNGSGPKVWWDPIRPLRGPGDWLTRVRGTFGAGNVASEIQRLFERRDDDGGHAIRHAVASSARPRRSALDLLGRLCKVRNADPALKALIAGELEEHERIDALHMTSAELRRALRGFALRLYPFQRATITKFLATGRLLLADDMGLGKTIQAAAIAHVLDQGGLAARTLVIAPASLKSQWVREWRSATAVPIQEVDGSLPTRHDLYASTKGGALVANYEQTFRDLDAIRAFDPQLVILDEAQRIKNWSTRTARTIKKLDVPYRLVLTGTPLENRLDELASIMDWVDPFVLAPKWRLGAVHQMVAHGSRTSVGAQNLDVLRERLSPRMLRRRRADVLGELPTRTDTIISVELTAAQRAEHDELSLPIARLAHIADRRPLTQPEFLRLMSLLNTQRVVSNAHAQMYFESVWPAIENRRADPPMLETLGAPKLSALRDLVDSVVLDQGRKVVVFSQWRRMLLLAHWSVRERLEGHGLRTAFFTGKESQKRRTANVVEFHDDPDLRVLFATDAGGVGLNLQRAATCCVNLEIPWNPAVLEQRVARIHRLGQTEPVDVYTLMSEPSIESRIAGAVRNKQALFSGLFDGDTNEVMFDEGGSFMATVQRLVDPAEAEADAEIDAEGVDPDEPQPLDDSERLEAALDAADERLKRPPELPNPHELRELFGELRIERGADGSVRIDASARAAQALGAVFSGMATLLERASIDVEPRR
jgi:hypothetical protein